VGFVDGYEDGKVAGYTTKGRNYEGIMNVLSDSTDQSYLTFTDKSTKLADEVTDDAWNYGISVGSGFISFGNGSPFVKAFRDSEYPNFSSFYLNSGPVVDQTFQYRG
jgi:hypothetical protein